MPAHSTKTLLIGLVVVILAVLLGVHLTGTLAQSEKTETAAEVSSTPGVLSAANTSAEADWADADQAATRDANREAAAGPQLDDTGPLGVVPPPLPTEETSTPLRRVGIQAGHWKTDELPDELARLRTSTGTTGGGVAEWELNLDIAKRVATLLEAKGLTVDVLPATIPPGYKADAFVALHADGDASGRMSGFKLARARVSSIPEADDALLNAITKEYQATTKLPVDPTVSRNMTGYYVFPYRHFEHSISPTTPGVILEMGFLTNASDRTVLLGHRDTVAEGIASGILRFLAPRIAGLNSN